MGLAWWVGGGRGGGPSWLQAAGGCGRKEQHGEAGEQAVPGCGAVAACQRSRGGAKSRGHARRHGRHLGKRGAGHQKCKASKHQNTAQVGWLRGAGGRSRQRHSSRCTQQAGAELVAGGAGGAARAACTARPPVRQAVQLIDPQHAQRLTPAPDVLPQQRQRLRGARHSRHNRRSMCSEHKSHSLRSSHPLCCGTIATAAPTSLGQPRPGPAQPSCT